MADAPYSALDLTPAHPNKHTTHTSRSYSEQCDTRHSCQMAGIGDISALVCFEVCGDWRSVCKITKSLICSRAFSPLARARVCLCGYHTVWTVWNYPLQKWTMVTMGTAVTFTWYQSHCNKKLNENLKKYDYIWINWFIMIIWQKCSVHVGTLQKCSII